MGVCAGVDGVYDGSKATLDKSKVTGIIRENEIGMLIGFAEVALDVLSGLCTVGLRYRLQVSGQDRSTSSDIDSWRQTFRFYSGVPLTEIIKSEGMHNGFLQVLFAGAPAEMVYMLLNFGRFLGTITDIERLSSRLSPPSDSRFTRRLKRFLLKAAGQLCVLLHRIPRLDADIGANQA